MPTNDFLPVAAGGSANVVPQVDFAANSALLNTGFTAGTAVSAQLNKVWRQSSIMSAVLAQFIVDKTGNNAVDDGTTVTLLANLKLAVAAGIPPFASSAENAAGAIENKSVDPLGIREAFNATGSAPVYACRAWVNFNGTGTVAIRASGNVSSITDNGTGLYTVNITTAISDANYGHQVFSTDYVGVSTLGTSTVVSQLAGSMQIQTQSNSAGNGIAADRADINVNIFR